MTCSIAAHHEIHVSLLHSCINFKWTVRCINPDSKVHEAYMGPTWGRQDPGEPHVGSVNLAIRVCIPYLIANQQFKKHLCHTSGVVRYKRPKYFLRCTNYKQLTLAEGNLTTVQWWRCNTGEKWPGQLSTHVKINFSVLNMTVLSGKVVRKISNTL